MNELKNIVGILDMDGFHIQKKFHCKELGILPIGATYASSYLFDIGVPWYALSTKDQRTCRYLTNNIHHLSFTEPSSTSTINLAYLPTIIETFYHKHRKHSLSTLAYKGGQMEKEILQKLNIPSINLENFGCPKAEKLFVNLGWLETCGHHLRHDENYKHCAKVETEAFGMWLEQKMSLY